MGIAMLLMIIIAVAYLLYVFVFDDSLVFD